MFDAWRTLGIELSKQPGALIWWGRYSGVLTEEFRSRKAFVTGEIATPGAQGSYNFV